MNTNDSRLQSLREWLDGDLRLQAERVAPASADASFRRYFRVWRGGETFIAMDAPPEKESIGPFVSIARMLADTGVNVPRIVAENRELGFLLLSDLGSHLYLNDLSAGRHVESHYADAMAALCQFQLGGQAHAAQLPAYDRKLLLAEMNLMPEWFCGRHLQLALNDEERSMLERTFETLAQEALAQPQVFVHRDYHSRNLMVCVPNPGILDFQDAVCGAVTYDLVSLLKDCYIEWPRQRVEDWVGGYWHMARAAGVNVGESAGGFLRAFDLMGAQRHIKVLGIFSRLFHRDGKPGYLKDLPRVLGYVHAVCGQYPELRELGEFLQRRVAL